MLAAAGLDRLGRTLGEAIPVNVMLPAPAQGAVGIEVRTGDATARAIVAEIDDPATHACIAAERGLLAALSADCHSPVGALARFAGPRLTLTAELLTEDGDESITDRATGDDPDELGARLGRALLRQAPPAIRELFGR